MRHLAGSAGGLVHEGFCDPCLGAPLREEPACLREECHLGSFFGGDLLLAGTFDLDPPFLR